VQTRRLAASLETFTGSAEQIPAQSHMRLGVFPKIPES